jgi:hypothetical protein
MSNRFHLVPKDHTHQSWNYSITRKSVFVIAADENMARRAVAHTLYDNTAPQPQRLKWEKITQEPSPWELDCVTSCEIDTSNTPGDAYHVWTADGQKWRTKYP